tara:strand:- start:260 stop:949 length:690 start_codon:yes stop_codon:yes gene_type:complete
LCGGLGTRIKKISNGLPKILLELRGTTFLEIQFEHFYKKGFRSFFYISGYKSTLISCKLEKIKIKYSDVDIVNLDEGNKRLGTGGALKKLIHYLPNNFFLTYGDNYLNLNFYEMEKLFYQSGKNLISIYKNENMYDKSNINFDERNQEIVEYNNNPSTALSYIDYGISLWKKSWIKKNMPDNEIFDLSLFYKISIEKKEVHAYEADERFYEIGTPQTFNEFVKFYDKKI